MKLLIVTQKVDAEDDVLGFFHRYLIEFSKYFEEISVICLFEGTHDLPANVRVYSLGKERGAGRLTYLSRFYQYVWTLRDDYDAVFVHMNPIYIVLAGVLWRILGKRIMLSYTHRARDLKLFLSERFAHQIVTASPYSFTLASKKVSVIGHGIDTAYFKCPTKRFTDPLRLISVGRISRIKQCEVLIDAVSALTRSWSHTFMLTFVGAPVTTDDFSYMRELTERIERHQLAPAISFAGSIPNRKMNDMYCRAHMVINMAPTGGVDKAILEGMAAGCIPIASNRSFGTYFGSYAGTLLFEEGDSDSLAQTIMDARARTDLSAISESMVKTAREKASIGSLIERITSLLAAR